MIILSKRFIHDVRGYSFANDNTGEIIEGANVFYLEPKEEGGFMSVSIGASKEVAEKIKELGAMYDLDLTVVAKQGKASLRLNDVQFLKKGLEV